MGLAQFTASPPSWHAYLRTRTDGRQTDHLACNVHRFLLIDTSGPSSLDSMETGGDLHRTRCMGSRVQGTGYSDINGTLHSMSQDLRHLVLVINLRLDAKVTGEITCVKYGCPQSILEVEQLAASSKTSWRFHNTTAQSGVVSDGSHNTCGPSFLAVQTLRLLGSKNAVVAQPVVGTPGMAWDGKKMKSASRHLAPATNRK